MKFCLNPTCPNPVNPDCLANCHACGTELQLLKGRCHQSEMEVLNDLQPLPSPKPTPIQKLFSDLASKALVGLISTGMVTVLSVITNQLFNHHVISIPNLGLSSSFASANLSAERYFRRALEKQRKGDYEGAIADYNEAIQINQKWGVFNENYFGLPTAYYNRGLAKYALGDNQAAIADYNEAIKIQPDFADAYYDRGLAMYKLGNNQAAIADYSEAIKIQADYYYAYNNRGVAKYALGDKQGAIADYNETIKIQPDDAEAYNLHSAG